MKTSAHPYTGRVSGTPPLEARHELRREVGFACPVPMSGDRCASPYLRWHHFDPPWRVRPHYWTPGMIALCAQHHAQAEAGEFSVAELRELKQAGGDGEEKVRRRLAWMRERLLAVVGGNFYYETRAPLQVGPQPVIAFHRDEQGMFTLDANMPSTTGEPRVRIDRNDWIETGIPADLECPPGGRLLRVRYAAGDVLAIEFHEMPTERALLERYGDTALSRHLERLPDTLDYPLLTVEITLQIVDVLDLGPRGARVMGPDAVSAGAFAAHAPVGLQL